MPENRSRFILHAEIVGHSPEAGGLDAFSAGNPIERRQNRIERVAAAYQGDIEVRGDSAMRIRFPSADATLLGACEMQHRCAALPQLSTQPLALRIGLHVGVVRQRAQDKTDNTENIAAQLALMDDSIVVSGEFATGLRTELRNLVRTAQPAEYDHRVLLVDWRREIPTSAYGSESAWPAGLVAPQSTGRRTVFRYGIKTLEINRNHPVITVGRDPQNDLVLADDRISRNHGRIEFRERETVLIDRSTNGTSILSEDGTELMVRKDACVLRGKGLIFFGRSSNGDRRGGVRFEAY